MNEDTLENSGDREPVVISVGLKSRVTQ